MSAAKRYMLRDVTGHYLRSVSGDGLEAHFTADQNAAHQFSKDEMAAFRREYDYIKGRVVLVNADTAYPLEIKSLGEDTYTLMSKGHHEPSDFMLAARADGYDWPLGMPKHIWLRCIPPPKGYATWYVEAKEGARGAFPATQCWEAHGDEIYEPIMAAAPAPEGAQQQ